MGISHRWQKSSERFPVPPEAIRPGAVAAVRLIPALLVFGALGLACAPARCSSSPGAAYAVAREKTDAELLAARIAAVSARYLGTPYAADPLGEGPGNGPDPDPLMDRQRVDCVTFVEQVLAEAVAPGQEAVLPTLVRLRYLDGHVGIGWRNHFFVADWLPHNRWLVEDVTEAVGGPAVRRMTKTIDRASLLRSRGAPSEACRMAPERLTRTYIPRAAVPGVLARIPPAALAVFVSGRPDLCAAHTGLLLARDGQCMLRHASQRRRRVMDEPLLRFLEHAPARIVGLKVYAIHPPTSR
jgi:N-acetylmuramoyl-L-alanine amidase-like